MANLKSSSPLLAQTSHPPTRNLSGKTHSTTLAGAAQLMRPRSPFAMGTSQRVSRVALARGHYRAGR